MGTINQAIGMAKLLEQKPKTIVSNINKTPSEISTSVFAMASIEGRSFGNSTQEEWRKKYLTSRSFILAEVPMASIALPVKVSNSNLIQRLLSEAANLKPVIVDVNRHKIGKTKSGFVPKIMLIDGAERFEAAALRGETKILSWIGADAADILDISADDEMSSSEMEGQLMKLINSVLGLDKARSSSLVSNKYMYISQVYPFENYCIYRYDQKEFRQHYRVDQQDRSLALIGRPIEVVQKYVDKDQKDPLHAAGTRSLEKAIALEACGANRNCGCDVAAQSDFFMGKDGTKKSLKACHSDFIKACEGGYKPKLSASAPKGWESSVKKMKRNSDIDNPWALANWMKDQGYTQHK